MSTGTKCDNHNPAAKLLLRRHFLRRFHAETAPRVLDCFQGSGLVWGQLGSEFALASYWGVDLKPKKGRLKIDSARILEQEGWAADVVDLDAYGSPWTHWRNLVRTFRGERVTVFLTFGQVKMFGLSANCDSTVLDMAGVKFERKLPTSLRSRFNGLALDFAVADAARNGLEAVEVQEAFPQGRARYIGVHLARISANVPA
jgi:hypothetical protein